MEAIVISGLPAAGKTTVSRILAMLLNVQAIGGGEILKEMAVERGYKPGGETWWDTPEGMRFLKEREGNPEFDREADRRLAEKIARGNIVVTSYTAPWIIKEGFKVWLDASSPTRAERMATRDNIEFNKSEKVVSQRDRENHKLYMELYHIDLGKDVSPFDLIVDTNKRSPEEIAAVILHHVKKRV